MQLVLQPSKDKRATRKQRNGWICLEQVEVKFVSDKKSTRSDSNAKYLRKFELYQQSRNAVISTCQDTNVYTEPGLIPHGMSLHQILSFHGEWKAIVIKQTTNEMTNQNLSWRARGHSTGDESDKQRRLLRLTRFSGHLVTSPRGQIEATFPIREHWGGSASLVWKPPNAIT